MTSRRLFGTVLAVALLLLLLAGCTTPTATPADQDDAPDIEENESVAEVSDEVTDDGGDATADAGGDADAGRDADAGGDADATENADGTGETATGSDGPTDEATAETSLPLDEDRVWERVTTLMASDAAQPRVAVDEQPAGAADAFEPPQSDFQEALNATETAPRGSGTSGLAVPGRVYIYPDGPDEEIEQVLAHEYAHAVQFADGYFASWLRGTPATTDQDLVQTALIEGGAVYVADEYTAEYLGDAPLQSEQMNASYQVAPAGDRLLIAPYHFGSEYVADEIDAAEELPSVYESPPLTTSELLRPDDDPPATDLSVTTDVEGLSWEEERTDTKGELYTRIVLATELTDDEAADAAAGWSDDELIAYEEPTANGGQAFAWTTQWETSADADDFEAAFESKLDRRTDEWADRTRLERVDDETVTVLIGPQRFHNGVEVSADEDAVQIIAVTAQPALERIEAPGGSATTPQIAG